MNNEGRREFIKTIVKGALAIAAGAIPTGLVNAGTGLAVLQAPEDPFANDITAPNESRVLEEGGFQSGVTVVTGVDTLKDSQHLTDLFQNSVGVPPTTVRAFQAELGSGRIAQYPVYHEFRVNCSSLIHWINEKVSLLKGFVLQFFTGNVSKIFCCNPLGCFSNEAFS